MYGVLGMGLSGLATIEFLRKEGLDFIAWDDSLASRDKLQNQLQLANPEDKRWQGVTCLIISPGMPLYYPSVHPIVSHVTKHGADIICDLELFYRFFPDNFYIGVTGTNGKSTTTALIAHVLAYNNIPHKVIGNIGIPALSSLPKNKKEIVVVEMSSYQLDLIHQMRFNIAILLNITKDHIDRHGTMQRYEEAKRAIFRNQQKEDLAVLGIDNEIVRNIYDTFGNKYKAHPTPFSIKNHIEDGIYFSNNTLFDAKIHVAFAPSKALGGEHNTQNIAAAYAATRDIVRNTTKLAQAIECFEGLPHRIQFVDTIADMDFINDSKATNAESTENALKMLDNIYWILGGKPKEGGIGMLAPFFNKITCAFLVGQASQEFSQTLKAHNVKHELCETLENAFAKATEMAKQSSQEHKTILLSPACASFDQWKNFEERGNYFIQLVKRYKDAIKQK